MPLHGFLEFWYAWRHEIPALTDAGYRVVAPTYQATTPPTSRLGSTAEDGAWEVTMQLVHDAGYDPVSVGGLDQARALEEHLGLVVAVTQAGLGPFLYRYAKPGEL
jgi:hypothetical protein